jgi:hypothetical protein
MATCRRGGGYPDTQYERNCGVLLLLPAGIRAPACDFLRGLLQRYEIELVHLNPNSILQIIIFVHLCEAFLGIPPNFPLVPRRRYQFTDTPGMFDCDSFYIQIKV